MSKFYLINKESLVTGLMNAAFIIAFLGSMNVWFMIPVGSIYPVFSFLLIALALYIQNSYQGLSLKKELFVLPVLLFFVLNCYIAIVNDQNVNAYIKTLLNTFILFGLCIYNKEKLFGLSTWLSKFLGGLLLISYPLFLLYLLGFPLPYVDMQYNDNFYSFSNYFFFLIDDRSLLAIIPRFQSIFLEPTYLGSTTALLLMTQRGHWKKWYNISMFFGLFISFSLAGYAYIVIIIFLNLWTNRKKVLAKATVAIVAIALFIGGAFIYNGGDNLVHDLILLRLEVSDGELEGNNRVSVDFDAEYETFLSSGNILFGEDFDPEIFGNSGYQVYVFDYGLIGVALLFAFYFFLLWRAKNRRAMVSAWIICLLIWGVDGFVIWFGRMIPLYITAYRDGVLDSPTKKPKFENEKL
ncbi:MAG: hypothetical protein ACOYJG_03130 [Prevotella sp.]